MTGGWLIVQKHLETFNGEVGPHPVFADVDRVAFSKVTRESRCKEGVRREWSLERKLGRFQILSVVPCRLFRP